MLVRLSRRFGGIVPALSNTRPGEWLRASVGAILGLLLSVWLCQQVFGLAVALLLIGPLGASAILLFAVPSGALAQPWPLLGSYTLAAVVATTLAHYGGHTLGIAALATGMSLLGMFVLRCVHPPGGAVALCVVLAGPELQALGEVAIVPVMLNAVVVLVSAVFYNNLTGVRYPKRPAPPIDLHHTRDSSPELRVGITEADMDAALADFGEFVDITREDLAYIIRATEGSALRRSMGDIRAGDIMSRDLRWATPETTVKEALQLLRHHCLRVLPVLDTEQNLVGIVSLVDLSDFASHSGGRRLLRGGGGQRTPLSEVMNSPVIAVDRHCHIVDLVPMLSSQGLHCLPVLENQRLVGLVTQTDLIAALHRDLLMHLS
ncbi:HPP family protein [Pseudomonas neustonica]|uniref:HPP family protein n=1 Tax=Pseudomonas neustonica TaxID=2487346 RepID=UPI003F49043C